MEFYRKYSVVNEKANLEDIWIDPHHGKEIVLGEFVNRKKPSYLMREEELINSLKGVKQ